MPIKLSPVAEIMCNKIMYSFGCTKSEAISIALEINHAFEEITDDQVLNYLFDSNGKKLREWRENFKKGLTIVISN